MKEIELLKSRDPRTHFVEVLHCWHAARQRVVVNLLGQWAFRDRWGCTRVLGADAGGSDREVKNHVYL